MRRTSGTLSYIPGYPSPGRAPEPRDILGHNRIVFYGRYLSKQPLAGPNGAVLVEFEVERAFDNVPPGASPVSLLAGGIEGEPGTSALVIGDISYGAPGHISFLTWIFQGEEARRYIDYLLAREEESGDLQVN